MNSEVIKSFLVSLGFGIDDSSLSKFNKAIESASTRVVGLYAAINTAAAGIFWGISKISEGFEQMGYEYRIIAPAIQKALILRRELLAAYSAAGVNLVKVVQQSVLFNLSLKKTQFALEALFKGTAAKFFPYLTAQMDKFRARIYSNMPKIQKFLETFVKGVFKAFEIASILGGRLWQVLERVYDGFVKLDEATGGWSTKILAFAAAWKFLNLSFLATPLGALLAGLLAILALWDDFQVWKEGGESLFNWSSAVPVIDAIGDGLKDLYNALDKIVEAVFDVIGAFRDLFSSDFGGFFKGLSDAVDALTDAIKNLLGQAIVAKLENFGQSVKDFFGGGGNGQYFNPNQFATAPIGAQPQNNQSNQHVNQQTQINVQGSADANSVGKQVASEQNKVNFDMVRNLKGATR